MGVSWWELYHRIMKTSTLILSLKAKPTTTIHYVQIILQAWPITQQKQFKAYIREAHGSLALQIVIPIWKSMDIQPLGMQRKFNKIIKFHGFREVRLDVFNTSVNSLRYLTWKI